MSQPVAGQEQVKWDSAVGVTGLDLAHLCTSQVSPGSTGSACLSHGTLCYKGKGQVTSILPHLWGSLME